MPFQALRFVHAASLLVDHQLHDVGPVDENIRPTLIDATVTAFERLVEVCVDQEVDFLLLTGDTFCESDRSLRARVALREGFECLREAGIEVFVVPGPQDPPSAWHEFPGLPENVSLFVPQTDEPTAVMRDGHVVATIQACSTRGVAQHTASDSDMPTLRTSPLRIGILPSFESDGSRPDRSKIESILKNQDSDYLAVPTPFGKLTGVHGEQLAHCPGPATAISQKDVGLCGCTLVTVDDEAQITARHFATSSVRRERIEIAVEEDASWDELISTMREQIESLEQLGASSVALLDWQLTGTGELMTSLKDDESEEELFELLAADTTTLADLSVSHRLHLSPLSEAEAEAAWKRQAEKASRGEKTNPFVVGLFQRLDESGSLAHEVIESARTQIDSESPWLSRLEEIVARVNPNVVKAHARRHGAAWLGTGAVETEPVAESEVEIWQDEDLELEQEVKSTADTHSVMASNEDTQTDIPVAGFEEETYENSYEVESFSTEPVVESNSDLDDEYDDEYDDDYDEEDYEAA